MTTDAYDPLREQVNLQAFEIGEAAGLRVTAAVEFAPVLSDALHAASAVRAPPRRERRLSQ